MERIELSVIIPVYNGADYIDGLIQMFCAQKFKNFEVIFVDDGSEDDTLNKCRLYEKQFRWIHVIHTPNMGVSHGRNVGIEAAKGKWLHFMDVDDQIKEGMYEDFYSFQENKSMEILVCGCLRKKIESAEQVYCGPSQNTILRGKQYKEIFENLTMEKRYWILDYIWNKWYRKEIIENLHLRFDEKLSLGEDFEFNTRYFSRISSMGLITKPYYIYLLKETGLSGKFQPEIWKIRDTLYSAHAQLYSALQISNERSQCVREQAGRIAFGDIRTINSKNCLYGYKDKIKFVSQMMKSNQYPLILEYLKNADKWKLRIYYYIFQLYNPTILWMVIFVEGKLWKR